MENPPTASMRRLDRRQRILALLVTGAIVLVFLLARWLTPDDRGLGTHEQLGLAPCRMLSLFHIPCPFCGMTTSFSLMVRGQAVRAFFVQPAGALIFILCAGIAIGAIPSAIAGRCPHRVLRLGSDKRALILLGACVALSWGYKIATHGM